MALQQTYTKHGHNFTNAYFKVDKFIRLGKDSGLIWLVSVYTDDTKTDLLDSLTYEKEYNPSNTEAAIGEAYTYMKSLPEYTSATSI